jgi:hypothetical protein
MSFDAIRYPFPSVSRKGAYGVVLLYKFVDYVLLMYKIKRRRRYLLSMKKYYTFSLILALS